MTSKIIDAEARQQAFTSKWAGLHRRVFVSNNNQIIDADAVQATGGYNFRRNLA